MSLAKTRFGAATLNARSSVFGVLAEALCTALGADAAGWRGFKTSGGFDLEATLEPDDISVPASTSRRDRD